MPDKVREQHVKKIKELEEEAKMLELSEKETW